MKSQTPFILGLKDKITNSSGITTKNLYQQTGQNLGNLAFHHAIYNQIKDIRTQITWDADVSTINTAGDIGIIPSANQIGEHADYGPLGEKFEQLSVNLVSIGLGAQSGFNKSIPEVPPGTLKWIKSIKDRSISNQPNIAVRGEFTLSVLESYGLADKVSIIGCPTLFISEDPNLGNKIKERCGSIGRIAITAGHPEWESLANIESSLANLATLTKGAYIGQSPLEMIQLTRGESHLIPSAILEKYRDYICPALTISEFVTWAKQHGQCYFDVSAWMEDYRRFDLIIGTRIHGVILGIQAGIPAICIAHDSRTVELCETMQIPHLYAKNHLNGIKRRDIEEKLFNFDADLFDKNRSNLAAKYAKFLQDNKLQGHDYLTKLFE